MSWTAVRAACDKNPTDTPHYIKAKEEMAFRLKRLGLILLAVSILAAIASALLRFLE